jgi:hypothetical protein
VDCPFIDSRLRPPADGTILDDFKPPSSGDRVGECGDFRRRTCGDIQQAKPRFRMAFVFRVGRVRGVNRKDDDFICSTSCGENHTRLGDVDGRGVGMPPFGRKSPPRDCCGNQHIPWPALARIYGRLDPRAVTASYHRIARGNRIG